MFFYNAVKLWNNVSENALVRSTDVKKFKRNFFDSVMCKFTPDSFKIDRIFFFFSNDLIFSLSTSFIHV